MNKPDEHKKYLNKTPAHNKQWEPTQKTNKNINIIEHYFKYGHPPKGYDSLLLHA